MMTMANFTMYSGVMIVNTVLPWNPMTIPIEDNNGSVIDVGGYYGGIFHLLQAVI
jgi:hypothetical protein